MALEAIDKANGKPYVGVGKNPGYGACGSNRNITSRELAKREIPKMKVQEYMLKALKDAVQMEVEGRQFYLEAAKKVKSAGKAKNCCKRGCGCNSKKYGIQIGGTFFGVTC